MTAIGVSPNLDEFNTTIKGNDYDHDRAKRVQVSAGFGGRAGGGGMGLQSSVFRKFLVTTDYRSAPEDGLLFGGSCRSHGGLELSLPRPSGAVDCGRAKGSAADREQPTMSRPRAA